MGHRLWEKVRCQHKVSAPSSSSAITHQPSKRINCTEAKTITTTNYSGYHVSFGKSFIVTQQDLQAVVKRPSIHPISLRRML
jgi:hypothetical protein